MVMQPTLVVHNLSQMMTEEHNKGEYPHRLCPIILRVQSDARQHTKIRCYVRKERTKEMNVYDSLF